MARDFLHIEHHRLCVFRIFTFLQFPQKMWWKCCIYEHILAKAQNSDQNHSHPDMSWAFHLLCTLAQSHQSKCNQSATRSSISLNHWLRWLLHLGIQGQTVACWYTGTTEYHLWSTRPQCAFSQILLLHICTETNKIIWDIFYNAILVLVITLFGLHLEKKVVGSKGNLTTVSSWQRHRLILPLGHRANSLAKSGGIVFLSIVGVSLQ